MATITLYASKINYMPSLIDDLKKSINSYNDGLFSIKDVPKPVNILFPSGNEMGANQFWTPGGFTSGGVPEAVINSPKVGEYIVSDIF